MFKNMEKNTNCKRFLSNIQKKREKIWLKQIILYICTAHLCMQRYTRHNNIYTEIIIIQNKKKTLCQKT